LLPFHFRETETNTQFTQFGSQICSLTSEKQHGNIKIQVADMPAQLREQQPDDSHISIFIAIFSVNLQEVL